ncbi:MAG: inward rectifier potassium channel [Patiriisocius sp.]|jgi:inward rectifier potassium channel
MDDKKKVEDVGFSTHGSASINRSINKNGSFNVVKRGNRSVYKDVFHYLISVGLIKFLLIILLFYSIVNLIFGLVYYSMGTSHFTLDQSTSEISNFLNSLFFSFQTFGTIGYGYISPISVWANSIVVLEIFLGMVSVALLAGLVYARFSKPKTRILFSNNVIFHEKDPKFTSLKFKLVNKRNSIMIDTEIKVILAIRNKENDVIKYNTLKLHVDKILFFPLTWTVMHVIDENSPLFTMTKENFKDLNPELLIRVKGFDDKYHQNVYANFSYHIEDWVWNKKFVKNFEPSVDGMLHMDVNDVHKYK